MAIQGLQEINVGQPNESTNSDSLYNAFNKTKDNFTNLFANSSPVPVAGNGIAISTASNAVTISANLIAGNNVILTNSSGAIIIDSLPGAGGGNGTITGVIAGAGLTGTGYFGNVTLTLASSGVSAAQYTNPTITIDSYGRITNASNNVIAGTVTSVGLTPGTGIQVSGGPITSSGDITVTNTGVTRLTAGTGIAVSSSNGNITVSAIPVTAILPADATFTGNVTAGNIFANSGNVIANRITANSGQINGNLVVTGNISPAAAGKVGGIQPGPGVNISGTGLLTIDNANLPISFGDFFANNNVLSIVNVDEDMILQTNGSAEIQLVGNIGFYKPDGIPPNVANRYFSATEDGQISILVANVDPTAGAVRIVGSSSGDFYPPVNSGVMLHISGQANIPSRIYNDGIGSFAAFVGRRLNGSVSSPTAVQAGDELIRISSTGYNGTSISGNGSARIVFQALENFTTANSGSNLSFWTAAIGSNTLTTIATIDNANGVTATKFTTAGTLAVTGNANIGNIGTAGLIIATGNITGGNLLSSGAITSNSATSGIGYRTGSGGAITQSTSKSDPVTLSKITGEITMNNASLGGDDTVSFTLTNTAIANTDLIILNQVSDANIGLYSFNGKCNSGNAIISVHNNTNTPKSDVIVIRFAVIKGAVT